MPAAQEKFNFQNAKAYADSMRTGRNPIISGAGSNYDAVAGAEHAVWPWPGMPC